MTDFVFPPARKEPPKTELLLAFLRRGPFPPSWVLRGSVVTRALREGARDPVDLDYLVTTPAWDPVAVADTARSIVERPEPIARASGGTIEDVVFRAESLRVVPIWEETVFPGVRIVVDAKVGGDDDALQLDFGHGDPLVAPNAPIAFHGVGPLLAVAPETMVAWKIHGLVEWGRGRWRPKDLYDLDTWLSSPIDDALARAALDLAFSSRSTGLEALAELLFRPAWGESSGRRKLWKKLAGAPDFARAKGRVVAFLGRVGLATELAHHEARVLEEDRVRAEEKRARAAANDLERRAASNAASKRPV